MPVLDDDHRTMEERLSATRLLICDIARAWNVTCADIGVEVRLEDDVTVRIEPIDLE